MSSSEGASSAELSDGSSSHSDDDSSGHKREPLTKFNVSDDIFSAFGLDGNSRGSTGAVERKKENETISVSSREIELLREENKRLKKALDLFQNRGLPADVASLSLGVVTWHEIALKQRPIVDDIMRKSKKEFKNESDVINFGRRLGLLGSTQYFESCSFCIDCARYPFDEEKANIKLFDVPKYGRACVDPLPFEERNLAADAAKSACFNCGGHDHIYSECPLPYNAENMQRNRRDFQRRASIKSSNRYFVDEPSFVAGRISTELRDALGMAPNEQPPWYSRMMSVGYPPGYYRPPDEKEEPLDFVDSMETDVPPPLGVRPPAAPTATVHYEGLNTDTLVSIMKYGPPQQPVYSPHNAYTMSPWSHHQSHNSWPHHSPVTPPPPYPYPPTNPYAYQSYYHYPQPPISPMQQQYAPSPPQQVPMQNKRERPEASSPSPPAKRARTDSGSTETVHNSAPAEVDMDLEEPRRENSGDEASTDPIGVESAGIGSWARLAPLLERCKTMRMKIRAENRGEAGGDREYD